MLAGLLILLRSAHEFDQPRILKFKPKSILDFGLKIGSYSATYKLVSAAAAIAAACPNRIYPVALRTLKTPQTPCAPFARTPLRQVRWRQLFSFFKVDFREIDLEFHHFYEFHQFDDFSLSFRATFLAFKAKRVLFAVFGFNF